MSTRKLPGRPKKGAVPPDAGFAEPISPHPTAIPPTRSHAVSYHWPLLLQDKKTCDEFLEWFDGIEAHREMPWRKKWIDPAGFEDPEELARVLSRRAYEVWVSEVMLQQTRVSTVISYFNKWIAKWPTIQDLAKANHDEVLAVWKGLGYYSRATRLHQSAQEMVLEREKDNPIPNHAEGLMEFGGIGRYTAGAISSIAYGEPEPVLDGNVVRVLSRQLGLYVDGKDKKSSDLLWKVADRLIKHVSGYPETQKSATPGLWNQALMELGSTVCTPRPKCDVCPIRSTCRAYSEGEALASKATPVSAVQDIEDACTYCEEFDTDDVVINPEDEEEEKTPRATKKRKHETKSTNTISQYFTVNTRSAKPVIKPEVAEQNTQIQDCNDTKKRKAPGPTSKSTANYCSLFPKKVVKKKATEQECVVCLIQLRKQGHASKWLIEQRPAHGLLASLWQFPQCILPTSESTASSRKIAAENFVSTLDLGLVFEENLQHVAEIDSLMHVFTHLKLTMHIHWFRIDLESACGLRLLDGPPKRKWVDTRAMEHETLSTGMRRCWDMVRPASS